MVIGYVERAKRKFPNVIFIPYDPASPDLVRERQSLIMDFEEKGWEYKDARKCNYYGEDLYFWVMEKK